jgi:CheY-like chemotaxis protein
VDFVSPREALQYISAAYTTNPVSTAILLDINMPGLNGWQVLDELEALPLPVKDYMSVYMLSSSIDPKDKQKAEEHPLIKGYIEKPLSREILQRIFPG